jgi:drug/metabolite transporter (DMT)-like permease
VNATLPAAGEPSAGTPSADHGRDNLRGSILMVVAMALFAIEDMFIKLLAASLPVGQILLLLGAGGGAIFAAIAKSQGARLWSADLWHRGVLIRNGGEIVGTMGFITAIALTPISSASAILQAIPLAVTLGAALFLGESVGWRRWTAIAVGFCGVLLVIRPGTDGFEPLSIFAVIGVVGLAARDLGTRMVPPTISSMQLSAYAFALLVPTGGLMMAVTGDTWTMPGGSAWLFLIAAQGIGVVAYGLIVAATRLGEVGAIAPFRYARIVFAMIVGVTVFGERPDALTLTGASIIVASGLYAFWRETRRRRDAFQVGHGTL